jgi:hypothetical protein
MRRRVRINRPLACRLGDHECGIGRRALMHADAHVFWRIATGLLWIRVRPRDRRSDRDVRTALSPACHLDA